MGTAYLAKSDGQTVPRAILKAGAAFAGAVTILILLMTAAGFI
jgi:hypothetical protein